MTTLFDTSAVLAAINTNEPHHAWSLGQLQTCKLNGPVIIPDIVYCEISVGMQSQADVDAVVARLALDRLSVIDAALFIAGKAFLKYKKENKGPKTGVLPDFLIGAFAEAIGVPLVTSNASDFKTYFPNIILIEP